MRDVFAVLTVLASLAGGVGLSWLASNQSASTLSWRLHASSMRLDAGLRKRERESAQLLGTTQCQLLLPLRHACILSEERAGNIRHLQA